MRPPKTVSDASYLKQNEHIGELTVKVLSIIAEEVGFHIANRIAPENKNADNKPAAILRILDISRYPHS